VSRRLYAALLLGGLFAALSAYWFTVGRRPVVDEPEQGSAVA
jgi:hypothetical protein